MSENAICIQTNKPTVTGASIHTNVLIKNPLPARGIVSSNPLRVERLLKKELLNGTLSKVQEHTNAGWGVNIKTAIYNKGGGNGGVELFIAVIPLGSTGAGFAFFEMFAAGAQAIVRYGANDATATMREFVIVDSADNLVGLPYAAGNKEAKRTDVFPASSELVGLLNLKASEQGLPIQQMICHNVEDYHAYNFSEFFQNGKAIQAQINERKKSSGSSECCWDMETAALYLRAQQFGRHAATVLLPTKSSLEIETTHFGVIFEGLLDFSAQLSEEAAGTTGRQSLGRMTRLHSTNDLIGVEEPLFTVDDVETGNNLFAEDDEDFPAF